MRRPLLPVALLYTGGILLASRVAIAPLLPFAISGALVALALVWGRVRGTLLWLVIPSVSWAHYAAVTSAVSPYDLRRIAGGQPLLVTVRGVLLATPTLRVYEEDERASWRTMAQIEVSRLQPARGAWQAAQGRLVLTTPGLLTNLFGGQVVEVDGVLDVPPNASAEGTFDYRAYLENQGIYYRLRVGSEKDWRVVRSAVAPMADRFREWAKRALARGLPEEDESLRLEWALALGWKTALTEEVSEPFIRAATYHIFAVDGLRMAILFGIFFALFRALGLSRAFCGALLIPLIWFYVALTGWPASAIRATVMLTVVIVGWVLRRPTDLLNSLFAAALIILVIEPRQLFQAGFQLSFVVVLCILLVLPPLRAIWERVWAPNPLVPTRLRPRWRRFLRPPGRYLGELFLTSLAAWLGSIPLVAYYFNLVTPVSTPANIVAVPLCALVLMSNLAALLLDPWLPAVSGLFNQAGWFLMELIRITSQWFASWPKAYFYTAAPHLLSTVAYYTVLLLVATGWLFRSRLRWLRWAAVSSLLIIWAGHWWIGLSDKRLTILNLSGGYGIYCDFPGKRQDLLIDCGTTNAVQFRTKPFLRAQGVNQLPNLVLSHGEVRQMGGAALIEELFKPREMIVGPLRFRSPVYRRSLETLKSRGKPVRVASRGEVVAGWTVLHPDVADRFAMADDKTMVLSRTIDGKKVLLISDLGRPGQEVLLAREADLRAEVLVAGLPVQGEALSEGLLDAIQPRLILICDSEFPASARASPALRVRLEKRGIPVLYARYTGSITLKFGETWAVRTMSGLTLEGFTESTGVLRQQRNDEVTE